MAFFLCAFKRTGTQAWGVIRDDESNEILQFYLKFCHEKWYQIRPGKDLVLPSDPVSRGLPNCHYFSKYAGASLRHLGSVWSFSELHRRSNKLWYEVLSFQAWFLMKFAFRSHHTVISTAQPICPALQDSLEPSGISEVSQSGIF